MIDLITQFGAESSGIGALGVDGEALVIQLVSFVLAFLVLKKWAFKPIMKMMNERRSTIESGVRLGEDMKKEKAELEAKVAVALEDARVEADKIIAEAHDAGRQTVQEAEDVARKKAESVLSQADDRIKQDTALARKKLEAELAGLVSDATEAIIHEKVDAKKDASLIDKALKGAA